jgi:hypothetical protein
VEVLCDLRLAQAERGRDPADRARVLVQQLDDPQPVRLGESVQERNVHREIFTDVNILRKDYFSK